MRSRPRAAYNSTAPANFQPVARAGDYILWQRHGDTPRSRVLADEGGDPGAILDCAHGKPERPGRAVIVPEPAVAGYTDWDQPSPPAAQVAGQERGWEAPGTATIPIELNHAGDYRLSLQYHSQVPLTVLFDGEQVAELPASLDGLYLSGAGRGAFWPAGEVRTPARALTRSTCAPPSRAGSPGPWMPAAWCGSATSPPRRRHRH